MSHGLGLAVTAEGVETQAQRQILISEACEDLQGYLFSPPMEVSTLHDRIGGGGVALLL